MTPSPSENWSGDCRLWLAGPAQTECQSRRDGNGEPRGGVDARNHWVARMHLRLEIVLCFKVASPSPSTAVSFAATKAPSTRSKRRPEGASNWKRPSASVVARCSPESTRATTVTAATTSLRAVTTVPETRRSLALAHNVVRARIWKTVNSRMAGFTGVFQLP